MELYDQGEIAGVLIFAGIWLEAGNMDARLEQSFALPELLQKTYYPHVGTASVKIVGEDHQPIGGAVAGLCVRWIVRATQTVHEPPHSASGATEQVCVRERSRHGGH